LWNVYTKLTSGPRLKVSASSGMKIVPAPPGDPTYIFVEVSNAGTAATTLTNLHFVIYDAWLARVRQRWPASAGLTVIRPITHHPIPFKLEVGGKWLGHVIQGGRFEEMVQSGKMWCEVSHSWSKRRAQKKIT
jgi:hypothetical protein